MPAFPAALRALLAGSIDYAGLFPPAALKLEPALQNYRAYLASDESWMLGAFVLPVAQFEAAEALLWPFDAEYPLRISALGAKTANAADFATEVVRVAAGLQAMRGRHAERSSLTQLEIALPPGADAETLRTLVAALAQAGFDDLPVFCEAAGAADVLPLIDLLGTHRLSAAARPLGFKLRTGGVVAAAFPSVAEVAAALSAAAGHGLAIKFTAGLHHPLRAYHDSVQTKMHGFLNMLAAAILAHRTSATAVLEGVLAEESADAWRLGEDELACGEISLATDEIRRHRTFVTSLGSCSFDEPREDLAGLLRG